MIRDEARLPTSLWVEAHLRRLSNEGIPYYILNTGNYASGIVLLKLNGLEKGCKLLTQERDFNGKLGWVNATRDEIIPEAKADEYIQRSIKRDPDIWVIEIEGREHHNPFQET